MNAEEFNELLEISFARNLYPVGFFKNGNNYFLEHKSLVVSFLNFRTKWSSMLQEKNFVIGIRHNFLHDLLQENIPKYPNYIYEYPFKIKPSDLSKKYIKTFQYHSKNDNKYWNEIVDRFEYKNINPKLIDNYLDTTTKSIKKFLIPILDNFTPEYLLNELLKNGSNEYCEKIWIVDYKKYLKL